MLEVEHASVPGFAEDISFTARKGEVLGFAGMIGAGRTELFEGLLGLRPATSAQVRVNGKAAAHPFGADAIEAGIGYLTEDRKGKGLLLHEQLAPNLTLSALSWLLSGRISMRKRREAAGARAGVRANTTSALKSLNCRRASSRAATSRSCCWPRCC